MLFFANSRITLAIETSTVQWSFVSEAGMSMELRGEVIRDQAGPRPPTFPQFAAENTALRFDGAGFLTMNDPGAESVFDFTLGDTITLEAWVRIEKAPNGQQMYVISKGRTGGGQTRRVGGVNVTRAGQILLLAFGVGFYRHRLIGHVVDLKEIGQV